VAKCTQFYYRLAVYLREDKAMSLKDRLVNWSFAMQGATGPQPDNHCRSAERMYTPETGSVWDEEPEDKIEPDVLDANLVEIAVCGLRTDLRTVVKARYISFPYHNINHVAHFVRMSPKKFTNNLEEAHRRLSKKLGEHDGS
jgi:hypothetical protein